MFRTAEYMFRTAEYTFSTAEYNSDAFYMEISTGTAKQYKNSFEHLLISHSWHKRYCNSQTKNTVHTTQTKRAYVDKKKEEIRLISVKVTIKENNDTYYIRNLLYLRSEKFRNVQNKSIILTNKTRKLLIKTDSKDHLPEHTCFYP